MHNADRWDAFANGIVRKMKDFPAEKGHQAGRSNLLLQGTGEYDDSLAGSLPEIEAVRLL